MRPLARLLALAVGAAAGLGAAPATHDVGVRIELDRESVVVHEQVVLDVVVSLPSETRARWVAPPFDGFWVEKLTSRSRAPQLRASGGYTRTSVFRRALFPTRSGTLEIAASSLELRSEDDETRLVPVPGARLEVEALPANGQAPRTVVVGQLEVRAELRDARVELGRALLLTVEVFGNANVWDVDPFDLEKKLGSDVEVFDEPPRVFVGESAGRASTRSTFRFQLVPRRAGRFEVPALEVPYFDTVSRLYHVARSRPLAFEAIRSAVGPGPEPWENSERLAPLPPFPWLALGLAGLAAVATSLYLRAWLRRSRRRLSADPLPSPRAALERAQQVAGGERFFSALVVAVKAGIHAHHDLDPLPLSTAEIAARIDDPEAIELLRMLDRRRFAREAPDPDPLLERVRTYLGL